MHWNLEFQKSDISFTKLKPSQWQNLEKPEQTKKKRKRNWYEQDFPSLKELADFSNNSAASSYLEPNKVQPFIFFSAFFSNSCPLAMWSAIDGVLSLSSKNRRQRERGFARSKRKEGFKSVLNRSEATKDKKSKEKRQRLKALNDSSVKQSAERARSTLNLQTPNDAHGNSGDDCSFRCI